MGLIGELARVIEDAKAEYEVLRKGGLEGQDAFFQVAEVYGDGTNVLAGGDNGRFLAQMVTAEGMEGTVQMIYVDPPFFSNANYKSVVIVKGGEAGKESRRRHHSYEDIWDGGMTEYLKMLAVRLYFAKALLKKTGTLWLHLDWHSVHYAKVLADEIFGEKNFVNEIIWTYKSGGSSKKHFARKHDTILVYSKSDKYYLSLPKEKSYNRGFKPYNFKGVEEFQDEVGWYTMVNMRDVWSIDMVGRTSAERTGYATQKPEALLRRIVEAATVEGDLCVDFFCGSGTMPAVASQIGRRWVCCDKGALAVEGTLKRVLRLGVGVTLMKEDVASMPTSDIHFQYHDVNPDECVRVTRYLVKSTLATDYCIEVGCDDAGRMNVSVCTSAEAETCSIIGHSSRGTELTCDMALIDGAAADEDFDGKTFKPSVFRYRFTEHKAEKGSIKKNSGDFSEKKTQIFNLDLGAHKKNSKIMIKVIDVFGNSEYNVIILQER